MRTNRCAGGRWLAVVTALAVLASTGACSGDRPAGGGPTDPYHADAVRYGLAPRPHPEVTYQPDVVLVGGGGAAVRSVTDDGLTWRIDPDAERADDLAPGKVMFLTSRAVGRVVDVRRDGGDLAVTIGPVELTEVIRDGTFRTAEPVPLDRPIAYSAGTPPWVAADLPPEPGGGTGGGASGADTGAPPGGPGAATGGGPPGEAAGGTGGGAPIGRTRLVPVRAPAPAPRPPAPPAKVGGQQAARAGALQVSTECCSDGVTARFEHDDGEIRMTGAVTLLLDKPKATFDLAISGGTVTRAEFSVTGGAGLRVAVKAATSVGNTRNLARSVVVPTQFSIPIGSILGVPFSATVDQLLEIKTAFSAKDGRLDAAGEYALSGAIGYGYHRPYWGPIEPSGFRVRNSLTNSITGISIGASGLLVTYDVKFSVGIGALGFTAGLYVALRASVGASLGSGAGLIVCRGAGLGVTMRYGLGYSIPKVVADVVNFFLKVFKTKPIRQKGELGDEVVVLKRAETVPPNVPLCVV
ncbi:hypothetical protein Q3W71_23700 [Micromonospora sp. C28SCA-DRY-2]|uniref:hypothetical protein n=1 Tax=Micromonospora sp. C28SCA-DRY-2 TaxID=3059522 RepID=UPI002676E21E|nr:hypothetical protein [Micromonospora sp. C28SCA-DRY-2]MDO3704672.1 hypothetical protein [Micromonospora sp. C28SCA-DRY-2]